MTSKTVALVVALMMSVTLVACSSSSKSSNSGTPTTVAQKIDYKALGLWDDGPCDQSKPPL